MNIERRRRFVAETVGTAMLLAAVVGSGIMADRLSGGNQAVALLANTIATGAVLVALILTFGPISGAHFNPAVTVADASQGGLPWRDVPVYICAQIGGAVLGVWAAHGMFQERLFMLSLRERSGYAQGFSEFVATFGLLTVIWGCSRRHSTAVPFAVAAYITAAYWFTASTSFANPAVTLARGLTDTFAGIRPTDIPAFLVAQGLGAMAATFLFRWLVPALPHTAEQVVVPHGEGSVKMKTVLFACVHNAGRSQMAAAWFNRVADPQKARAISAGTDPGTKVRPEVIAAMSEVGVDLSGASTTRLTPELAQQAQVLVTMGCGDQCPFVPGAKRDDWPLEDPKGQSIEKVREIRDEIRERVTRLVATEGWS